MGVAHGERTLSTVGSVVLALISSAWSPRDALSIILGSSSRSKWRSGRRERRMEGRWGGTRRRRRDKEKEEGGREDGGEVGRDREKEEAAGGGGRGRKGGRWGGTDRRRRD